MNIAYYTCFYGDNNNEAFKIPELPSLKNNIKLFWTVWEFSLVQKTMNEFLVKHYKNFYHDNYTDIFEKMNRFVKVNSKGKGCPSHCPEVPVGLFEISGVGSSNEPNWVGFGLFRFNNDGKSNDSNEGVVVLLSISV